jgi:hypothetical protein
LAKFTGFCAALSARRPRKRKEFEVKNVKEYFLALKDALVQKHYKTVVLHILLIVAALAIATVALIFVGVLVAHFINFILDRIDYIFLAVLGILGIGWAFRGVFGGKTPAPVAQAPGTPEKNNEALRRQAEEAYELVRVNAFSFFRDNVVAGLLRVVPPESPGRIESPNHFTLAEGYTIFHFLLARRDETSIDPKIAASDLNQIIKQRLSAGEMTVSPAFHVHDGNRWPALFVDSIVPFGKMIAVDMVLVNDAFCARNKAKMFAQLYGGHAPGGFDRDF